MTTNVYLVKAKSNLHAGAGSSNYGVIDNLVQRDATDSFPTIFSTSIKGAFKEWYKGNGGDFDVDKVFGSKDEGKSSISFSDAHLLAIPLRSNQKPYFMATCPYLLRKFTSIVKEDFGYPEEKVQILRDINTICINLRKGFPMIIGNKLEDLRIEDFEDIKSDHLGIPKLKGFLGENIVILSDDDMKAVCSDYSLPVIARNCLENGQSINLWYEQVIPRETCFYVVLEGEKDSENLFTKLNSKPIIQIGANATVGYGRCSIQKLNL